MPDQMIYRPGLDGVIAAETQLSYLDTEKEEIVIRGYELIELAGCKTYTDLIHLLLHGSLPAGAERSNIEANLIKEYSLPQGFFTLFEKLPSSTHPMDALRTGVSALAGHDERLEDRSPEVMRTTALRLLAKIPNIVANSYHILQQKPVIEPTEELSYSANFLYMITGTIPIGAGGEVLRPFPVALQRARNAELDLHRPGHRIDECRLVWCLDRCRRLLKRESSRRCE